MAQPPLIAIANQKIQAGEVLVIPLPNDPDEHPRANVANSADGIANGIALTNAEQGAMVEFMRFGVIDLGDLSELDLKPTALIVRPDYYDTARKVAGIDE